MALRPLGHSPSGRRRGERRPLPPARPKQAGQPPPDQESAQRLYRLFTVAGYYERNVIPAQQREEQDDPFKRNQESGFGILKKTRGAHEHL